jgi:hypothetical protein
MQLLAASSHRKMIEPATGAPGIEFSEAERCAQWREIDLKAES